MSGVSYPPGVFDHAAFHVPHLSDIPGNPVAPPVPLTNPHFQPTDPCLPVINALFGHITDTVDLPAISPPGDFLLG